MVVTTLASALLAAALAILIIKYPDWRSGRGPRAEHIIEPVVFLFAGKRLRDATPPARRILATLPGDSDWTRLSGYLALRFPGVADAMSAATQHGHAEILQRGSDGGLRVVIDDMGRGVVRFTLDDLAGENVGVVVDARSMTTMEEEISSLRDAVDSMPILMWRENASHEITWVNAAYLKEVEARSDDAILWPMPRLIALPADAAAGVAHRLSLKAGDTEHWLECHIHQTAADRLICALPADTTVRAEKSLKAFVQTLSKTFADLPIGLAIFDRERRLHLFNPALINLTGLSAEFLALRPSLYAFLDRLREARMVPEPKDYPTWRKKMTTLEAAAARGHHVETWILPSGQTYRVTGRPHPDGAVAFVFEDITSEAALTRRFKAELSLGAELLNTLDEAMVVFDGQGRRLTSNAPYAAMWGPDLRGPVTDHLRQWEASADQSSAIPLRDALAERPLIKAVRGTITGPDGHPVQWTTRLLSGGRFCVSFSAVAPVHNAAVAGSRTPDQIAFAG
ncbi:MAG: histidine kinase [Paracoccus denitrificans]|nr:MAG: histidine kinase [Paracoccus denitrificans]PZO86391.1 MAG: histidine kinase [Paracoccus denitrificans]